MAKQNGSTSCTLKKKKQNYNKVVLETALLFPNSDLNLKRSSISEMQQNIFKRNISYPYYFEN